MKVDFTKMLSNKWQKIHFRSILGIDVDIDVNLLASIIDIKTQILS